MADRQVKVIASVQATNYLSGMDQMARKTTDVTKAAAEQKAALASLAQTGGVALVAIGVAAAGAATLAVAKFAEFDQAMSFVAATGKDAKDNQDALREAAIKAGAATVFSATESANAIEEMAKAGVSAKDILAGGLTGALNLAAAGGLGVADAAGIAATALTQFGLKGQDMGHVADLLSAGAGKAQGEVTDLAQALKFVGPVAAGMGVSIEETTGALALFASQGILADQAGTGLRGVLGSLTSPSTLAKKELDKLGVTLYDGQGKFLGLANMAGQLEQAYGGMSDAQKDASLGVIFGNQQITTARILLKGGQKGVEDWTKAVDDQGFAARTAAERLDNLRGDIEQLGGAFDTALIKMGSAADGVLRGLVQTVTDAVTAFGDMPSWVQATTLVVVALTGAVALLGGGFLLLLPRILETGAALTTLSASTIPGVAVAATRLLTVLRSVSSFALGPWGIALAVAAVAVGVFAGAQANATAKAKEYEDSLDSVTGKITESTREITKANLATKTSFLWMEGDSVFDAAEKLGIGLDIVTDAALGNADAIKELKPLLDVTALSHEELAKRVKESGLSTQEYLTAVGRVAEGTKGEIDGVDGAKKAHDQKSKATVEDTAATVDNSAALAVLSDKAEDAEGDISDLADAIANFGKGQLDVNAATRDFQASIDDLTKSVKDNGKTLDVGTEKGRANQSALDDIAKSALGVASATITQTGSQKDASKAIAEGRAELIKALKQFGITGKAAEEYADNLGLIPGNVYTAAQLSTAAAELALKRYIEHITSLRPTLHIQGQIIRPGDVEFRANGGTIGGVGTSKSDSNLAFLSRGEEVIQEPYATRFRPQLKAMNQGIVPQFAGGGTFQPAPVYTPAPARMYSPGPGAGPGVTNNYNLGVSMVQTPDPGAAVRTMMRDIRWAT